MLIIAAVLVVLIGLAHSYLGERYILIRLFRRSDLPKLFGSDWFTKRTLRFAWHITTLAWWGLGGILFAAGVASTADFRELALWAVAATFFVTAVVAAVASGGRHLSWPVFLAISVLTVLAI
jgi:hypothetical protein